MNQIEPDSNQRATAKIVGFVLLGLAFTMLIAGLSAPIPMQARVALCLVAAFGVFWAYRFMRLGRGSKD